MNRVQLLNFLHSEPWAILPAALAEFRRRIEAGEQSAAAPGRPAGRSGNVAVLGLHGPITQRASFFQFFFGGTSVEGFSDQFRQAVNDETVGAVVIDVDSPGGTVSGVDELSAEIQRARGSKPIVAVANTLAASAAYWIASAADKLVVTPTGEVGSIGVVAVHQDESRWLDAEGITTTLIAAGKFKTEGNPFQPLTEEAREAIQSRVNDYYTMFTRAVARNRGASVEAVRNGYGEGRVVGAKRAVELGMADEVGTLRETIAGLARAGKRPGVAATDLRQRRLRLAGRA